MGAYTTHYRHNPPVVPVGEDTTKFRRGDSILKKYPYLKLPLKLAWRQARKRLMPVFRRSPEDVRQEVETIAVEIVSRFPDLAIIKDHETSMIKAAISLADTRCREAYLAWVGFRVDVSITGDRYGDWISPEHPRCGVAYCNERGVYEDDRLGRICRAHKHKLERRRKTGWSDPYERLDCPVPLRLPKFPDRYGDDRRPLLRGNVRERCCVAGCYEVGVYESHHFKARLCRGHYKKVERRMDLDWIDPYEGMEFELKDISLVPTFPSQNRELWEILWETLPTETNDPLWRWAKSPPGTYQTQELKSALQQALQAILKTGKAPILTEKEEDDDDDQD